MPAEPTPAGAAAPGAAEPSAAEPSAAEPSAAEPSAAERTAAEPVPEDVAVRMGGLTGQLAEAVAAGLERFDGPRVRFVRRLLARAEESAAAGQSAVAARLLERVAGRLEALEEDFDAARMRAEAELGRLEAVGADPGGTLRAALDEGDVRAVFRAARRRPEREPRLSRRLAQAQGARLREVVGARASVPPPAPEAAADPVAEPLVLAARLYAERTGEARARRALDELKDELPAEAGPYHGPTVAARALEAVGELHRPLLLAWIARLRTLEPPPPPPPKKARRR